MKPVSVDENNNFTLTAAVSGAQGVRLMVCDRGSMWLFSLTKVLVEP